MADRVKAIMKPHVHNFSTCYYLGMTGGGSDCDIYEKVCLCGQVGDREEVPYLSTQIDTFCPFCGIIYLKHRELPRK
jgi:hypothetical protein